MIDKKYAFVLLFTPFLSTVFSKTSHQQVVATTKEVVQGRQFVHTYQMIDGIAREAWAIDGSSVDKATYEDTLLTAEMAERRAEREQAYAAQAEELSAKQRLQQGALKKLVKKGVAVLQQQLAKIETYGLLPYMAYAERSLSQEQFENLTLQLIPQAQELVAAQEPTLSELQAVLKKLEWYEKGMQRLVRDSTEQAIAQCDDTVMLKKLLA